MNRSYDIEGCYSGVKVLEGNIESALSIWKRRLRDSNKLSILKDKKEYNKPSRTNRKKRADAIRQQQFVEMNKDY